MFSAFRRDVRTGARALARRPGFVTVVVLTLALGIGATTTVFSLLKAVLIDPLPYSDPARLVRLYQVDHDEPGELQYVTGAHLRAYREETTSFEEVAALYTYSERGADLIVGESAERVRLLPVSAGYFEMLGALPVPGRTFTRDEETDARLVVLSHRLWQTRLDGRSDVVGDAVSLSGEPYTIIGVAPEGFEDPIAGEVDAWIPQDLRPGDGRDNPENHFLTVLARLAPGVSADAARAELARLDVLLAERYPETDPSRTRLIPLKSDLVRGADRTLGILMAAVALVLLVACVNVANLFLIRATGREREFAIRAALGSGRARLARQLLVESLLLALAGGAAGVAVALLGVDLLAAVARGSIPRIDAVDLDARVLAFTTAVSLATGLLFGLIPALRFSRERSEDVLRGVGRSTSAGRRTTRIRDGLVVAQVGLALVLLVGAGLLITSFHRLGRVDLGIRTESLLTFRVNLPAARYDAAARVRFHAMLADRLGAEPGVRAAGAVSRLPATGTYHSWGTRPLTGPGAATEEAWVPGEQRVVAGDYFEAAGLRLLEGRLFSEELGIIEGDGREAVLGRATAESLFPGVSPIGQTIRAGGDNLEVVGVVSDVALTPEGLVAPAVYQSHAQFAANRNWSLTQVVAVEGSRPVAALPALREAVRELDPLLVVHNAAGMAEIVGQGRAQRRFALVLLTGFSAMALGLAALGLYGVLAYSVRQRTRELAIRSALGAGRAAIRRMVLRQGLVLTLAGSLLGLLGALALGRTLSSLAFETDASDPAILAAATATLLLAAVLAAWLPARRATAIEARDALEGE